MDHWRTHYACRFIKNNKVCWDGIFADDSGHISLTVWSPIIETVEENESCSNLVLQSKFGMKLSTTTSTVQIVLTDLTLKQTIATVFPNLVDKLFPLVTDKGKLEHAFLNLENHNFIINNKKIVLDIKKHWGLPQTYTEQHFMNICSEHTFLYIILMQRVIFKYNSFPCNIHPLREKLKAKKNTLVWLHWRLLQCDKDSIV